MAKFSMWIKHQTKNLLYTPKLWWGYNIKILPQKKKNTFLKLSGQQTLPRFLFSFSREMEHVGADGFVRILPTSSPSKLTPSIDIHLNTDIKKSDTLSPTLLCALKDDTELLLKWHSAIKSPCLEAQSWDDQSQMVQSASLCPTTQCDTLFWCIPSVLHNILWKRWWPINQLTSGARLQIKTRHPVQT